MGIYFIYELLNLFLKHVSKNQYLIFRMHILTPLLTSETNMDFVWLSIAMFLFLMYNREDLFLDTTSKELIIFLFKMSLCYVQEMFYIFLHKYINSQT